MKTNPLHLFRKASRPASARRSHLRRPFGSESLEPRLLLTRMVEFNLSLEDSSGAPITDTILIGEQFDLVVSVEDVSDGADAPSANMGGVFSAFLDVSFDGSIVTPVSGVMLSSDYNAVNDSSTNDVSANLINNAGGTAGNVPPFGDGPRELFRVTFQASAVGDANFTALPVDSQPGEENLLPEDATGNEISAIFDIFLFGSSAQNDPVRNDDDDPDSFTLIDNDSELEVQDPPQITIGNESIVEGNSGTKTMTFTVQLDRPADEQVMVDYTLQTATATGPGSGISNNDFVLDSGTVTIPAGQSSGEVDVTINGDVVVEPDEQFQVLLSNAVNAELVISSAIGTILNDDTSQLSISDAQAPEGNPVIFNLSLTNPVASTVSFLFQTSDGTATAPGDYIPNAGQLVLNPGQVSGTISVTTVNDLTLENDETFLMQLSSLVGGSGSVTISDGTGVGTILNNDFPPSSLSGSVFVDYDDDGVQDPSEFGIGNVTLRLMGTNDVGQSIDVFTVTGSNGSYSFPNLRPGTYSITETQPAVFRDGEEYAGTVGGQTVKDNKISSIQLPPATDATGYNFTELGLQSQFLSRRMFLATSILSFTPLQFSFRDPTDTMMGVDNTSNNLLSFLATSTGLVQPSSSAVEPGVRLELYDIDLNLLAQSTKTADGGARIDYHAPLNEQFVLRMIGSDTDGVLSMANAVRTEGDTFFVDGSPLADVIEVIGGDSSHTVIVNGVDYAVNPAATPKIVINGGGGDDQVTLTGTDGYERFLVKPREATGEGSNYDVTVEGVGAIQVAASAGDDVVKLFGERGGNDHLHVTAELSQLRGDGYVNASAPGLKTLAFGRGGNDIADFYGTEERDILVTNGNKARFLAGDVDTTGYDFGTVHAFGHGGDDKGRLVADQGHSDFSSEADMMELAGSAANILLSRFNTVKVFGDGDGTAELHGTAETIDTYASKSDYARLSNNDVTAIAFGFGTVQAFGDAQDKARLHGSDGNDTAAVSAGATELTAAGTVKTVFGFGETRLYGEGGHDSAVIHDTPGAEDAATIKRDHLRLRRPDAVDLVFDFEDVQLETGDSEMDNASFREAADYTFETAGDWLK